MSLHSSHGNTLCLVLPIHFSDNENRLPIVVMQLNVRDKGEGGSDSESDLKCDAEFRRESIGNSGSNELLLGFPL